jgi:uncharacterized protein (DUF305 family)
VLPVQESTETEDITVLPWWRNPINAVLICLVILMAGMGIGSFATTSSSQFAHNSNDVGFLQDMRIHHEQAVTMAVVYLGAAPRGNVTLRTIAREIMLEQSTEAGRMVQMLRMFKESETNETDQVMSWMGTPLPLSRMPGYASDAELDALYISRNAEADKIFATLMVAHHKGGIHMAEHASTHGRNDEVRALADAIVHSQQSEITELIKLGGL